MKKTDEEIASAKSNNIKDIAEMYGYTFKAAGNSYLCREDKGLVLFKKTNSWFNYYENTGGNVIDFVMHEDDISFPAAVDKLLNVPGGKETAASERLHRETAHQETPERAHRETAARQEPDGRAFVLPEKNENNKRVFAYLTKTRHISADVVRRMLHDGKLYEDKRHNCIFVAEDANGFARHGFIRGTVSDICFRGDVPASDKCYGFSVSGETDRLIVFEAPIDLLSYMTLYPKNADHKLALGMLSPEPILTYVREHPEIKQVGLSFDADKWGRAASERFKKDLPGKIPGIAVCDDPVVCKLERYKVKDVNMYLGARIKEISRNAGRVI